MLKTAILCLALNIYHEARNQPVIGQIAEYPNNNKNELPIRNKCQFSWYCNRISDQPTDIDAYRWALTLSERILSGEFAPVTNGATHYHSTKVNPKWKINKIIVAKIKDHIFYRWKIDQSE